MHLFNRLLYRRSQQSLQVQPPKTTLTSHLLASTPEEYQRATQAPFLLAAAEGRLSKDILGKWLADERLYFHSYIRAAGKLLASIELPQMTTPGAGVDEAAEMRLVDWVIEDLGRIRGAEKLLLDVAGRYGIEIGSGSGTGRPIGPAEPPGGGVAGRAEGMGLKGELFDTVDSSAALPEVNVTATSSHPMAYPPVLPWLEAAVMFWATERCYLDAWSWAKAHQPVRGSAGEEDGGDANDDADGGAMRREFIPSWSSDEFREFVARLAGIIDGAVDEAVEKGGAKVREQVLKRVEGKWKSLVVAEEGFWPVV